MITYGEAGGYAFLAVFEKIEWVAEPTRQESDADPRYHPVSSKWTKSGDLIIKPGESTLDVIAKVASACKSTEGGVPRDALMTGFSVFPSHLVVGNVE